jgi:hypothetical protein
MEKMWHLGLVIGILFLSAHLVSAATIFTASLSGDQEVPLPITTLAMGTASLLLNDVSTLLEIDIEIVKLDLDGSQTPGDINDDMIGVHIHRGASGINGPVVFGLINPNTDLNDDLAIDPVAGTIFSAWDLNEGNGTTLSGAKLANFSAILKFSKICYNHNIYEILPI